VKVLIFSGYGVFGIRLACLLRRDRHTVCVAGRDLVTARRLADEIGATALQIDRAGDLSALNAFDAVVDAAGPCHAYGPDPYRLAKATIAGRVHCLDLSDNAAFCQGIVALDAEAQAAGVCGVRTILGSGAVIRRRPRPRAWRRSARDRYGNPARQPKPAWTVGDAVHFGASRAANAGLAWCEVGKGERLVRSCDLCPS
jgi:hypothetical protein